MAFIGVVVLFGLLVAAFIFSPDGPSTNAILVSAQEQTYVEAVTKQRADGFLDPFTVLAVYYIQVGGWFQETQRIQVFCGPHDSDAYNVGFRRRIGPDGRLQIEVKRPRTYDEIHTALVQEAIVHSVAQQLLHPGTEQKLPDSHLMMALEDSARARVAAKDSLVLSVFIPPAIFPKAEAKLHKYDYDCRKD